MNLLLVEPSEVTDATVVLADRRAEHLRVVLGAVPGSRVRAGLIGGETGTAEVLGDDGVQITLALSLGEPAPAPLPIELVLAMPRPKVLSRVIEAAASFAVERITLTNAWRVDKSYLRSPRLAPESLAHAARLWLWQPWRTRATPLVWVLHAAYAWIVVHLALRGLTALDLIGGSVAAHALTVGAIGGMTLGMMTRTARGHTGRPLVADGFELAMFWLIHIAAVIRVFAGLKLVKGQASSTTRGSGRRILF